MCVLVCVCVCVCVCACVRVCGCVRDVKTFYSLRVENLGRTFWGTIFLGRFGSSNPRSSSNKMINFILKNLLATADSNDCASKELASDPLPRTLMTKMDSGTCEWMQTLPG